MWDERRKEIQRKRDQYKLVAKNAGDVINAKKEAKEKGATLEDMIEDGYMIKCEGCGQLLHTDTFFKHASHSKKCKEAYGPRLEIMKKEKRKEVKSFSYKKNKEKSDDYYQKNKMDIAEKKKQRLEESKVKEKEEKKQKSINDRLHKENDCYKRKIQDLIRDWRDSRLHDRKKFSKIANPETKEMIQNMISKICDSDEEFRNKISKSFWQFKGAFDLQKQFVENHFEDWKKEAKLLDDSFKTIVHEELTCFQCYKNEKNCTSNCEFPSDLSSNITKKVESPDIDMPIKKRKIYIEGGENCEWQSDSDK